MSTMSSAGTMPAPEESTRRGRTYGRAWIDHAGWIIAAGLVGATIAGIAAISRPDIYRAHTLIQVNPKEADATAPRTTPFDPGILRSRAVVGPVAERLRLDVTAEPLRAPLIGGVAAHLAEPGKLAGPWPERMGYAWGGEKIDIRIFDVPARLIDVPMQFELLPSNTFRLSLNGKMIAEGNIGERVVQNGVTFQVAHVDAQPGTRFVLTRHDTMQTVDTIARELQIDSTSSDSNTVRIAWQSQDRTAVAALINGIANSYIGGQAESRRDDAAATLAFLNGELPRVKAELDRAEAALLRYRSRSGSMQPSQDAQSYLSGSMDYQKQIAQLRLERTRLLQRFTTESNEVRTMDNQIVQLMRERQDMDSRMKNLSLSEREAVALTRDVKVSEDMYMSLRNRIERLSLDLPERGGPLRMVDSATTPTAPIGIGAWPLTAGGGLLGMLLAMGCISVRQRVKPVLANVNEAEERHGMMMLGDIAFSREQVELEKLLDAKVRSGVAAGFAVPVAHRLEAPAPGNALTELDLDYRDEADADEGPVAGALRLGLHDQFLLARNAPYSLAIEGLRSVRAAMHFTLRSTKGNVVAITSPAPGAGKTFISINLAVLFAEAGKRVLLVDADLRRGRVASWFDQPNEFGLAQVLAGHIPLQGAVRPTVVSGLSILPAGAAPANPSELLMQPSLADSLHKCSHHFDLVLVDTPPVLAVADATLVANLAGSTLVVLRADATMPEQVDETLKRLSRADATLLGGILNGVKPKRSNRAEFKSINPYLGMPTQFAAVKQIAVDTKKA